LPRTLAEGLRAFQDGEAGAALLGAPLAACLAKLKRSEQGRFEDWCREHGVATDLLPDQVTDWEQREYFRVY
jgi:glutamine synthetase